MNQVHGIIRRSSSFNTGRIDHIYRDRHETGVKLFLHYGDLCDATNLITIIANVKPQEIYNLGAMSHVKVSFDMPEVRGRTLFRSSTNATSCSLKLVGVAPRFGTNNSTLLIVTV